MNHNRSRRLRKMRRYATEAYMVYRERREGFEVAPVHTGWFFWRKLAGWAVDVLIVEGADCSAPMGSIGYLVPKQVSEILPTKFAAYRWLVENVQTLDDVEHYRYYAWAEGAI